MVPLSAGRAEGGAIAIAGEGASSDETLRLIAASRKIRLRLEKNQHDKRNFESYHTFGWDIDWLDKQVALNLSVSQLFDGTLHAKQLYSATSLLAANVGLGL